MIVNQMEMRLGELYAFLIHSLTRRLTELSILNSHTFIPNVKLVVHLKDLHRDFMDSTFTSLVTYLKVAKQLEVTTIHLVLLMVDLMMR